jgi:hypothetical protein
MMNKKEIERFEKDYKTECKSGLKLFAWIVGTWVLFGIIILLIFL